MYILHIDWHLAGTALTRNMAISNSVIFAAAQEIFDLVLRKISSELEGDGKLGKSLQILMQFETESAAKADGGDIIATNTISLQRRYKI